MHNVIANLMILLSCSMTVDNSVKIIVEGRDGIPIPGAIVILGSDKKIETDERGLTKEAIPFYGEQIDVTVSPPLGSNYQKETFHRKRNVLHVRLSPSLSLDRKPLIPGESPLCGTEYNLVCELRQDAYGNCYKICKRVPCTSCIPCDVGEAKLTVSVPEDAEVFINDRPTKSTGARRVYLSKGLGGGINYWYRVRVRIVRDGKVFEEIREVVLRAGDSKSVSVDFSGRNISHQTDARPQRDSQRSR